MNNSHGQIMKDMDQCEQAMIHVKMPPQNVDICYFGGKETHEIEMSPPGD